MTKSRPILQWNLRSVAAAVARLLELLGFRANSKPTIQFGEREYDHLVLASTCKRWADHIVAYTDAVSPGDHYAVALRLYADSLRLATLAKESSQGNAERIGVVESSTLVNSAESDQALVERVQQYSIADVLELSAAERMTCVEALRRISGSALGVLAGDCSQATWRLLARPLRMGLTTVATIGLLTLTVYVWDTHANISHGKAWRASSSLANCQPIERGGCPGRPGIFFHTASEENPWIEYDLGERRAFTAVTVENAKDSNAERAVPLVVEVSDDQAEWREVARISTEFKVWKTTFPEVKARYVRFRVPRVTYLHLSSITIHR